MCVLVKLARTRAADRQSAAANAILVVPLPRRQDHLLLEALVRSQIMVTVKKLDRRHPPRLAARDEPSTQPPANLSAQLQCELQ